MIKLAQAPTIDKLKQSIARYWYTTPDKIKTLPDGSILQTYTKAGVTQTDTMTKHVWRKMRGGYAFYSLDKS